MSEEQKNEQKKGVTREVWLGLILALFSLFFIWQAQDLDEGAKYPTAILGVLCVMSVGLLLQGLYYTWHPEKYHQDTESVTWQGVKDPLICFVLVVVYLALFKLIGFFISTAIFVPVIMYFFGERKIRNMLLVIVGLEAFVYVVFVQILNVNFGMV